MLDVIENVLKSVKVAGIVSGASDDRLANFDIDYSSRYLPEILTNIKIQSATCR
jgi:hypothetical protein